ncbi:ATP-binding protein [Streptomyces sp. HP-A2021]|uniref:ATP-binding protein n=1 Tax=Streptomyces sp. HP-A2021 TaxID=2927875 RepID=UPI002435E825|nr:ATP-binding protein [Streptomyces sp. HP-A2021]
MVLGERPSVVLERHLHRAKFEQQATLGGFDFNVSPKLPAAQIRDHAALRRLHSGESVILFGPVGSGSHTSTQALGHQAVRQGANVRFAKTSRILAELAGGHADRTWDKRMRPHPPRPAHPRRLLHAPAHRTPGRRPIRTRLRAARPIPDHHQQPSAQRLVSALPQRPSSPSRSWTA